MKIKNACPKCYGYRNSFFSNKPCQECNGYGFIKLTCNRPLKPGSNNNLKSKITK